MDPVLTVALIEAIKAAASAISALANGQTDQAAIDAMHANLKAAQAAYDARYGADGNGEPPPEGAPV